MFCGTTSLAVQAGSCDIVHRLSCRCWDCEDCRPLRLRMLRDLASSGDPSTFVTLTASSKHHETPDDMARALVHAWRMVVQRGKREGRWNKLPYLAVFESHKSGYPHLHILCRAPWIDQAWLSERMEEYAHGPRAWVQAVRDRRKASQYIAKYISKGPGRYEGCKRYWRTQDYQRHPLEQDNDLPVHDRLRAYLPQMPESVFDAYARVGWSCRWSSWWRFEAIAPEAEIPRPWLDGADFTAPRAPP